MTKLKNMSGEEFLQKVLGGERDLSRIKLPAGTNLNELEGFKSWREYFEKEISNDQNHPLVLDYSDFSGLVADELYLGYPTQAKYTCFQRASLVKADFSKDFERADFREADLTDAHFLGTIFKKANFNGAKLVRADFSEADLSYASLEKADLTDAVIAGAYLGGVNLKEALLQETDFYGSNFYLVTTPQNTKICRTATFQQAKISGACFTATDLRGVKRLEEVSGLDSAFFNETIITPVQRDIIERALREKTYFIVKSKDREEDYNLALVKEIKPA